MGVNKLQKVAPRKVQLRKSEPPRAAQKPAKPATPKPVDHFVASPRDTASGLPTGKRMHKPYAVTTDVSTATPLMYDALTTNRPVSK
jgi:hypothetical protein